MSFIRAVLGPDSQVWPYEDAQTANDVRILHTVPPHQARPGGEDDYEVVDNGGGPLAVRWKHGPPRLPPDARHVGYEGPAHLCNACLGALGYLARNLEECIAHEVDGNNDDNDGGGDGDGGEGGEYKTTRSVVHHQNLMALLAAANGGCHLCATVRGRRFAHDGVATAPDVRTELCWNTTDRATWDGSGRPGDARLICNVVSTTARSHNQGTWQTIFRFQLWPSPGFDPFFERDAAEAAEATTNLADKGNTRSCRPAALRWVDECRAGADGAHAACQRAETSWYPTRLLDLSTVGMTGRVLLVVGDHVDERSLDRGEYITLSHCWGAWGATELPVLTESNIDERVSRGMELSLFPTTFRDAIDVAGWFNIRWLWIDSLCIIQGSAEDWRREAPTMCNVYQHAFLNISADHAVDARGGCFRDRHPRTVEPFKLTLGPLRSTWWVSVDERNLFAWITDAPSSERAWIYQERHLARRVLHFTDQEVFFECHAAPPSFRSETYPRGSPLRRAFLGQTKLRFSSPTTTPSSPSSSGGGGVLTDDPFLMLEWDAACRDYSRRKLTYASDKLPALSGIARRFASRCPGDTYLAGMWVSQLPLGLFWEVPKADRPRARPAAALASSAAPSWSWLSWPGPIQPSRLEDSSFVADVAGIALEHKHNDENDPYGAGLARGQLHVYGLVRRVTSVMDQMIAPGPEVDAYRSSRALDPARRFRHLYLDGRLDRDVAHGPGGVQLFGEMPDWFHGFEPVEYHCLLMTVSQDTLKDDRVLRGLLLERVAAEGERSVFRRVGHIFFLNRCALKVRYRLRERTTADEEGAWERLWERAAPYWGDTITAAAMGREPVAPVAVDIQYAGQPAALYEFDPDMTDDDGFDRLEPELITLI